MDKLNLKEKKYDTLIRAVWGIEEWLLRRNQTPATARCQSD
jgi:hypothetical protein